MTLGLNSKRQVRRVLRGLRDVRKRAGKVRDMDVLTADALTIREDGEQDCLVQLLEHLGANRNKCAKKLRLAIETATPQFRRILKQQSKHVEKRLKRAENDSANSDAVPATMAKAIELASELRRPAHLSRKNLHPYRLKVKEMRNILQLSNEASSQEFFEKLGEVKDAIGEWHDWEALIAIARKLLNHGASCKLVKHLKVTSDSKYETALTLTNSLRSQYLKAKGPTSRVKTPWLSNPVLRATSAIAES